MTTETPEAEKVYFKIDGQFITDFARTRVIEGCWRHAMSILSSISGTDYELSEQILKCKKRFVGTNTFKLVDEDPERDKVKEYLAILHYQYAELLYIPGPGTYWRPYAYVSGYGPDDYHNNQPSNNHRPAGWPWPYAKGGQKRGMPALACGRALHYIERPGVDATHLLVVPQGNTYESWVFFQRVSDPPLWTCDLDAVDDPQKALDAHIKSKRPFEERGWYQWYADEKQPEARGLGKWSAGKSTATEVPEPEPLPEQKYSGPPHSETDVERIAKFESGWLDRAGRFYPCGYSEHRSMAEHICEMVLKMDLDNLDEEDDEVSYRDAEVYLDKKGWAKRTIAAGGVWLWDCDRLTKIQMNVIATWYSSRDEKIPVLLQYRLGLKE